jgi:integrase
VRGCRPLNRDEALLIRDFFIGPLALRNQTMFAVGNNTGFRVSELLSLRLGDVVEIDGTIVERLTVSRKNMKGKVSSRSVPVNPQARQALRTWLLALREAGVIHRDDVLFASRRDPFRAIGRRQAWKIMKRAYLAAGIKGKTGTHSMRKTFANNVYTNLLQRVGRGEPIDAFRGVSKALGHRDIKSTDQYLSFAQAEVEQSIMNAGV